MSDDVAVIDAAHAAAVERAFAVLVGGLAEPDEAASAPLRASIVAARRAKVSAKRIMALSLLRPGASAGQPRPWPAWPRRC